MADSLEKQTAAPTEGDISPSNRSIKSGSGDSTEASKTEPKDVDQEEYPHGVKLVLLSLASMVAVFLIALDQVSI